MGEGFPLGGIKMSSIVVVSAFLLLQTQIDLNIEKLAHDNYQVREAATNKLISLGQPAFLRCKMQENYNHPDPEVRRRVRYVVKKYYCVTADDGSLPSIYAFNEYWHLQVSPETIGKISKILKLKKLAIIPYYQEKAQRLKKGRWNNFQLTELLVTDLLDAGVSRKQVQKWLNEAVDEINTRKGFKK